MTSVDEENSKSPVSGSRIPAPVSNFRRSASLRVRGERPVVSPVISTPFPSIAEREELVFHDKKYLHPRKLATFGLHRSRSQASDLNHHRDEDLESVDSFASIASHGSSSCEHAYFAKNGTTYSGRNNKYVVHCPSVNSSPEEYLTPTQRANKSIRRLKTLLQLAKEKLLEKEQEIFKLTKEVVELKVFKASVHNTNFSEASSPSDGKDLSMCLQDQEPFGKTEMRDFACDTYNDLSPIKTSYYSENKNDDPTKMSPCSPPHCSNFEKLSATPDYLLCSLADSGNFDDLASSLSLNSKDSAGFSITPDLRALPEEQKIADVHFYSSLDISYTGNTDARDTKAEQDGIVSIYENRLTDTKFEYEVELRRIMEEKEASNIATIVQFECKLKEQEKEFEERWQNLLKTTEEEKIAIVDRFEERLDEEKKVYMENLMDMKASGGKVTDMIMADDYVTKVEQQKAVYETSLAEIKCKFENEKMLMEKKFDDAMSAERQKFEDSVADIKNTCDKQVAELMAKISQLEANYDELLPKYEEELLRSKGLEKENEDLKATYSDQEERQRSMYLKMFMKGQEAEKLKHADEVAEFAAQAPNRVSVPELLVQLKVTETELENLKAMYKRLAEAQERPPPPPRERCNSECDPEATLQFLKSAVYYFLTDYENQLGHLRAIESILGFSEIERRNIDKSFFHK